MIQFNYYAANIKSSKPLGTVNIQQFFNAIKNPNPKIKDVYERIKQAELDGDLGLKAQLKERLYSFTPCVQCEGSRSYSGIKEFTGLMVLDFDHLDPTVTPELKEYIFENFDFVIATWLSASKCGVRALVHMPVVYSVEEFKSYFMGLEYYSELGKLKGFDHAPNNPVLPLFLSHDPDLICGDTDTIWTKQYFSDKPKATVKFKSSENPSRVEKIIKASIDKITDNGHPQLRAAAFVLGGYVGGGAIGEDEAINLIHNLIKSNTYLSHKPDVYIRTANEMINKGTSQPLYL